MRPGIQPFCPSGRLELIPAAPHGCTAGSPTVLVGVGAGKALNLFINKTQARGYSTQVDI